MEWARRKEEELVDRMLSQFPEFGTNRPTPFTALDDDGDDDEELSVADGGDLPGVGKGAVATAGRGAGGRSTPATEDESTSKAGASGSGNPLSPGRFLSDDASDLLGRLFFGAAGGGGASAPPSPGRSAAGEGGRAAAGAAGRPSGRDRDFRRTSSFGSSSSVSTMTASAAGGATGRRGGDGGGGAGDRTSDSARPVDGHLGRDCPSVLWDQDEIDLWSGSDASSTATSKSKKSRAKVGPAHHTIAPSAVEYRNAAAKRSGGVAASQSHHEQLHSHERSSSVAKAGTDITTCPPSPAASEASWPSRRRRHREMRRKKRQDWDALRLAEDPAAAMAEKSGGLRLLPSDPPTARGGASAAVEPSFHSQEALLTALQPDPAAQRSDPSRDDAADKRKEQQTSNPKGGGGAVIVDDGKQHWMPDHLCKHCYSCEAPFTLLRRKHHCRVCGMIFCSACSAYFVQISSSDAARDGGSQTSGDKPTAGTMRTCKMCYDHLSERGLGVIVRGEGSVSPGGGAAEGSKEVTDGGGKGKSQPPQNSKKQSSSMLGPDTTPVEAGGVPGTQNHPRKGSSRDILLPMAAPNPDLTTQRTVGEEDVVVAVSSSISATAIIDSAQQLIAEQFAGFQGAGSGGGDFRALSLTKQRLDEEGRRREEQERAEAEEAAAQAAAASKAEDEAAAAKAASASSRLKKLGSSVRQLKWSKGGGTSSGNTGWRSRGSEEEEEEEHSDAVEVSVRGDDKDPATSTASLLESKSGIEEALAFGPGQSNDAKLSAKIHLGMNAASYLEKLGRELLQTDAPLLLEEIQEAASGSSSPLYIESKLTDLWVNTLMTLATRCCATVEPDVKNGDLLDIRPYCKVKVIPGGSVEDSAYMSGVVFHKNVSHKKMSRGIQNCKIMMLSGGIEYTRAEKVLASLDTLLEQEERYMEILVTKIFKLKPHVLIVGKSVCRKAQELLLRADIALLQYVKPTLMTRIARQTGATVLSTIDHVAMNSTILGFCRRFRLVSFRDNDVWVDGKDASANIPPNQKSVPVLLSQDIPNHERQAALAARKLGEKVLDGMEAVTLGLAKRGVVKTYVMIEGCPKELGCTVVLRGASRPALKMVKRVLRFITMCAYNMKLETSYILERCCRLPPSYVIPSTPCSSSSLCVDFGQPPNNRKARPWNGGKNDPSQRSLSGKITPLDHQAILITSVWMTDKTQCCPAEVKGICYYSMQDVSLGQFLRDSCFNLSLKCQNPSCKKSVIDHSLSFIHNDGLINISVEHMDNPIPTSSLEKQQKENDSSIASKQEASSDYEPIATWTFCTRCNQVVTPLTFLSNCTWQWSFGKFLEVYFYNRDAIINAPAHRCSCRMQTSSQLFFGCGSLAARFTYEKISPYSVFCRRHLPFDEAFHRMHSLQDLEHISVTSSSLFSRYDKQIEAISRETRELFGSAMNKPEHLQAVLSELNLVSAEVGNASKVLQEKISSVTAKYSKDLDKRADARSEALFNFPWYSRRYLFMLATAWNERLSAAGQALSAMKKIQSDGGSGRGDSAVVPIVSDGNADVIEGMKRIRMLQETYSRNYNVAKMTMPRSHKGEGGLFEGNILPDGRVATLEQEAEIDDEEFYSDPENIDFDDVDADVLASRNRVYSPQASSSSKRSSKQRPKKVLAGKKNSDMTEEPHVLPDQNPSPLHFATNYDTSSQLESQGKSKTVTAGGAVKSALTRFFNRGSNKEDPYVVDLGLFGEGRPRLQPGIGGSIIPVFDDQPSTIIAHSLASSDYDVQFKQFLSSQSESRSEKHELSRKDIERRMLGRNKSHIKHTFRDFDEKGQQLCKFVCTTFWSVQFNAVRQAFMNPQISSRDSSGDAAAGSTKSSGTRFDIEKSYIRSLAQSFAWAASGGKSGAAFSRTTDDRFVIKCISRTELQMFLDCAPAYFEYLSKAFFHGLPTVLCKIVGVYQIGYHNRVTGRRTMEQVAVMQNIFFGRKISKIFDLKGSLRGRFTRQGNVDKEKKSSKKTKQYNRSKSDGASDSDSFSSGDEEDDDTLSTSSGGIEKDDRAPGNADRGEKPDKSESIPTLLDGDFLEFTSGRPLPLTDRAKAVFHMSILNDTLFLSIINVLDYSILVGIDEEKMELVVGIIDFMRQYDILKQMERVGKSLPMVVGSEAPTIIQPPLYKARFTNAMERYFMTVPSKWTTI